MTSPDQGGSGAGSYSNAIGALDGHTLKYSPEEAVRRVRDQDEGSGAGSTVNLDAEDERIDNWLDAWGNCTDEQLKEVSRLRADLAQARARIEKLLTLVQRASFALKQTKENLWLEPTDGLIKALDAAQATAEPTANDHETARAD